MALLCSACKQALVPQLPGGPPVSPGSEPPNGTARFLCPPLLLPLPSPTPHSVQSVEEPFPKVSPLSAYRPLAPHVTQRKASVVVMAHPPPRSPSAHVPGSLPNS